MAKFNSKEIAFLKKEFNLSDDAIKSLNKTNWLELREKCVDIEIEESVIAAEHEDNNYDMPEREIIAVHLAEKSLSELGFE